MSETRKLAAILVADVVGYSRLAGMDEDRTLARLRALRSDLVEPTIAVYHGRVVKRTGDGFLVEFRSVVDAVRCAKLAMDRKIGGALIGPSSYFMKSPPQQFTDNEARERTMRFIDGDDE